MKTMKKLLIALLSLAAIITTSCKNDLGNTGTVKGDGITAGKTVEFTITTTKDYTLFPEDKDVNTSISRTIVSDGYGESELKFYLFGTNRTTGTALTPQEVTFTKDGTNTRKGTTNLQIGSYVWNLFIAACDKTDLPEGENPSKDDILAKAVLLGEVTADLRGANKTVDFVLTPDDLTKTGTVNLKIYTDGWSLPENYTVDISLVTKDEDKELFTTTPNKTADKSTKIDNLTNADIGNSLANAYPYTANTANIKGGKYKFQAEFTAPTGKSYWYSDDIIILPGKGNTSTVKIPYVIEVAPTAPTAFKVGYVTPTDKTTQFYTAVFEWTRSSSKTEKYYELEIMSLGKSTDESNTYSFIATASDNTDDTAWDTQKGFASTTSNDKTTVTKYGENFYKNPSIWVAGSLAKASEFASTKLELGNRYNARIRAVNEAGESDWVYVSKAAITKDDSVGKAAAAEFTSTTMNLYRLTYETTGCTWTTGPTSTISYNCESTTGIAIKAPDGKGTDGTLKDASEAVWTNWKGYNEPGVAPAAYKGFENLTLIPVFAKAANINIYNDADYIIPTDKIGLSNSLTIANGSVTIDIANIGANTSGERNITWTITFPEGKTYTSVYLTMARTSSMNSYVYSENIAKATNSFVMNVAGLEGTYIAVLHYTINGREYTTPITIQIVE